MLKRLIQAANSLDEKGLTKEADILDEVINKLSSIKEVDMGTPPKQKRIEDAAEELSAALEDLKEKYYFDYYGDNEPHHWNGPMAFLGPAAMEMLAAVNDLKETFHAPGYGDIEKDKARAERYREYNEREQAREAELAIGSSLFDTTPDEDLDIIGKRELINREREATESF